MGLLAHRFTSLGGLKTRGSGSAERYPRSLRKNFLLPGRARLEKVVDDKKRAKPQRLNATEENSA